MKYTFLLPAFKGRFLDEMLRSIQGQTYRDYKVIISDDCSPEDLRSICEPYLADPRFTYRRNAENMGSKSLVSHWNLLVDMCDTDYLILASDDDVYEPQFLEEMDTLTTKYPQVDLFRARTQRISNLGNVIEIENSSDEYEHSTKAICSHFQKDRIHCISNYLFKASILQLNNGFVEFPLAWFSDDATVLNCLINGICNTKSVCFNFRNSDINISNDKLVTANNAKMKINATQLFYDWYHSFSHRLIASQYKEEQEAINCLNNMIHNRINGQLHYYFPYIVPSDKIRLLRWMRDKGFDNTNKIHFLKSIIYAYLGKKNIINI